jgi:two-component system, chemotaxis family, protein-glutamate methylesterase/glutaminase
VIPQRVRSGEADARTPVGGASPAFDVVVIGTSAGGLSAVAALLDGLPSAFSVPVVLVLHLSPDRPSLLVDVLARRTRLRVQWAVDGGRLEAGTVHVAPPDHHVVFKADGTLLLVQSPRIHYSRPSVDMLFASAAQAFGSRTLAIILTGTGNDGSDGVPVVHRHGGVVIAQDEASSQFFSMPREAIESGAVSFVLPLSAIAPAICRLVALGVGGGGVGGTPVAN